MGENCTKPHKVARFYFYFYFFQGAGNPERIPQIRDVRDAPEIREVLFSQHTAR
jgi:hypothetical protein